MYLWKTPFPYCVILRRKRHKITVYLHKIRGKLSTIVLWITVGFVDKTPRREIMELKRKGKTVVIAIVLAIVLVTFIVCAGAFGIQPIGSADESQITVVLDAGHGGIDGGVVGVNTRVKESVLNLAVVKKLETLFLGAGIDPVLTRSSEAGLYGSATNGFKRRDMLARKKVIEHADADIVISVHMNKYGSASRRGAQVFFRADCTQGISLANKIQNTLNQMDEATRGYTALKGDYYILNCTDIPSVIVECGFLSNAEDEALLVTDVYQEKLAYAIFKGAIEYLSEITFYGFRKNKGLNNV